MRNIVAGFVVGAVLATAVSIGAQPSRYFGTKDLVGKTEQTQLAYVSGVSDTLSFVLWFMANSKESYDTDFKKLRETETCLDFRGRTLSSLRAFAVSVWNDNSTDSTSAAARLLVAACEP